MPAHSCSAASVYSGFEVDDDWCASVLQSYQAERDTLFPWSVGKSFLHLLTPHSTTHIHVCITSQYFYMVYTLLCYQVRI